MEKTFREKQPLAAGASRGRSAVQGIRWDLSDLYVSMQDPNLHRDQDQASELASVFRSRYEGQIQAEGITARLIADSLQEYEELLEVACKPMVYARLLHSADSQEAEHGALLAATQEAFTAIQTRVMFYELDWIALPDEVASRIARSPECSRWRHFLEKIRVFKPYTLTEPEEIILAEKEVTGLSAFRRLFDEITSSSQFEIEAEGVVKRMTQSEVLSLLYHPERKTRQEAHRGLLEAWRRRAIWLLSF